MTCLLDRLPPGVTFIAGSEKNAGKTTLLNLLLAQARRSGRAGYLSIGVDGESRDMVFGNPKPRIYSEPGDLVVTSQTALANSSSEYRVLEVFESRTVLGRTVLAEIIRGGFVELTRPGDNSAVADILPRLRDAGAGMIFVDGASDRVTQAASAPGAGYVFVLRATGAGVERAAERARMLAEFDAVPETPEPRENEIYISGAFTQAVAETVPQGAAVVVEDFTRVFLSPREFAAFTASRTVSFRRRIPLRFICVLLRDIARQDFLNALGNSSAQSYIVFNPYEAAHG